MRYGLNLEMKLKSAEVGSDLAGWFLKPRFFRGRAGAEGKIIVLIETRFELVGGGGKSSGLPGLFENLASRLAAGFEKQNYRFDELLFFEMQRFAKRRLMTRRFFFVQMAWSRNETTPVRDLHRSRFPSGRWRILCGQEVFFDRLLAELGFREEIV